MAPSVRLTKGTKEYIGIDVSSALGTITTLDGKDLRFDVYTDDDAEISVVTNASGDNNGMLALLLINSTSGGLNLAEGKYKCFITFDAPPESPRLGPFRFTIDD